MNFRALTRWMTTVLGWGFRLRATAYEDPDRASADFEGLPGRVAGARLADQWPTTSVPDARVTEPSPEPANPLREHFDRLETGPGLIKWLHYFPIYHEHFRPFIGRPVVVVEVGVYGGGSLALWHRYFGPECTVHGIDIEPVCRSRAGPRTHIHIGDQADPRFWADFRAAVPRVDILIDDGGHLPHQQRITAEEMLGHLSPGGVYLCEDIHGTDNAFAQFVFGLASRLNAATIQQAPDGSQSTPTGPLQSAIHSVHLYPFVVVVKKNPRSRTELSSQRRGTEWP